MTDLQCLFSRGFKTPEVSDAIELEPLCNCLTVISEQQEVESAGYKNCSQLAEKSSPVLKTDIVLLCKVSGGIR